MAFELVQDSLMTGRLDEVLEDLKRTVSAYQRHKYGLKIGITNNPTQRSKGYAANHPGVQYTHWRKMVVLYKTSSHKSVSKAEKILIDYCQERFPEKCRNKQSGGSGINNPESFDYFYTYLVVTGTEGQRPELV